ncbi:alpha/beta hydrolase [Lampropedia puyangensis]|uniref:Alpha/beta hydrolase n=1 Tax=Lampropedia puyangensis TaxID=1330072 RepID=A0A4V4GRH2_9BURK|nr:alpha/beta hydrolase [Lampropedia puyangensis]
MHTGHIEGFTQHRIEGADGVPIDVLTAGQGPALLLLHGCPQTRMCWRQVACVLQQNFTVVLPDLRGYGRSGKPEPLADHSNYSKRTMALDQIQVMQALRHNQFFVAGHDRGGRVAYRLALDHPHAVQAIAVLDIVPTLDVWNAVNAPVAMRMWHWPLFAQEDGLPEALLAHSSDYFVDWGHKHQSANQFAFPPNNMADYRASLRDPANIRGMCEDYRASWHIDRLLDQEDQGKRFIQAPLLALWGEHGNVAQANPIDIWKKWATFVQGKGLPGGHFLPEEAYEQVATELMAFFSSIART